MTPRQIQGIIQTTYDKESSRYANFQENSFAWKYIEKPGFDKHITDFNFSQIRMLDIGCGSGVVIRYFINRGVRPQNIIGIDISKGQLAEAKHLTPDVTFLHTPAENFIADSGRFDLIVSNMAFHHFDDEQFAATLRNSYHVLADDGTLFFIDTHPDYNSRLRSQAARHRWHKISTPWGSEQHLFNRGLGGLLNSTQVAGFRTIACATLPVIDQGETTDPTDYQKYTGRPSRIAIKLHKPRLSQ
jgi:SAM-dependent methyltransferase